MKRPTRLVRVLASASLAAVMLVGCTTATTTESRDEPNPSSASPAATAPVAGPSIEPTDGPAQSRPAEDVRPVSGGDMGGHVHNLAYDGRRLLIGTHDGLWGQDPSSPPTQVSSEAFDVMGFTRADAAWFASGHPGEGMDAPSDLGLLQSTDQGRTWVEVSLGGEVDFHRLVTSGEVVMGLNAHDGRLLRSDDAGGSWTDLGVPGLHDVAVKPDDPSVVIGTTENGPVRSVDSGVTFEAIADAPLLALLAWTGDTVYAADVDGRVHQSTDDGLTWSPRGSLPAQPGALAADGPAVAAHVDDVIHESLDGGATFSPRLTELGGH